MTRLTTADVLANAAALGAQIESVADAIERDRRIPHDLIEAMRAAGIFQMAFPESWGASETDPVSQSRVVETLSYHDASVGWIAMICSDSGHYAARVDDATARELYPTVNLLTSGFLFPVGTATEEGDNYRVSGRWQFGSGCLHADRLVGGCIVHDANGMKLDADGRPDIRAVWLPLEHVTIHDTWMTTGLAGSGSNDYSVADLVVPQRHSFKLLGTSERTEPLYQHRALFLSNLPGVPLGCAQRMLDDLRAFAETKVQVPSMTKLKDEYRAQVALAEGTAKLAAARTYHYSVMSSLWDTLCAGDQPTQRQRADILLMSVLAVQTGTEVAELVCEAVGGAAVYRANPFDRRRRDLATVAAHALGQRKMLAAAAQLMFGEDPPFSIV